MWPFRSSSFDLQNHVGDIKTTVATKLYPQAKITSLEKFSVSDFVRSRFETQLRQNQHLNVQMVFHGTSARNYSNIRSKGLVVPGKHGVRVVNGSAHGVGIYLSLCPRYSLSYVRDEKQLLVCAVLVGDYSKVTQHGNILVAKDESYVLPCFVLKYSGPSPQYSRGSLRRYSNPAEDITTFFLQFNFVLLSLVLSSWILSGVGFALMPSPYNFIYYIFHYSNWFLWYFFTMEISILYFIFFFIGSIGIYIGIFVYHILAFVWPVIYSILWAFCFVLYQLCSFAWGILIQASSLLWCYAVQGNFTDGDFANLRQTVSQSQHGLNFESKLM